MAAGHRGLWPLPLVGHGPSLVYIFYILFTVKLPPTIGWF